MRTALLSDSQGHVLPQRLCCWTTLVPNALEGLLLLLPGCTVRL